MNYLNERIEILLWRLAPSTEYQGKKKAIRMRSLIFILLRVSKVKKLKKKKKKHTRYADHIHVWEITLQKIQDILNTL